jgi:N-acetylmuramoyl-L-alanine amidase
MSLKEVRNKMKILLIAGHGNGDPGAVGTYKCRQYRESNETREIVKLIADALKDYADVTINNINRNAYADVINGKMKLSAFKSYDYVLEIHMNAHRPDDGDGRTKGTEIYVTTREVGISVERAIVNNIAKVGLTNRGVKKYNWAVINTAKSAGVSSALLEVCFIDDADDMKIYTANKPKIAQAIADGIIDEFGLKKSEFIPYIVRIKANKLNVRKYPGVLHPIVTKVKKNEAYTIIEEQNGWGRLKSKVGWIKLSYTTRT